MADRTNQSGDGLACDEVVETLYLYLDGELDARGCEEVRRHLDDCAPCFEAFGFEAELRSVIAARCQEELPAELRERILTALRRPRP